MTDGFPVAVTELPLLEAVPSEIAAEVATLFVQRTVQPGEDVFVEGEPGSNLVAILAGSFELVKGSSTGEVLLAEPPAGTVLGHISLIDGAPRSATLRAATEGRVALLSKADFDRVWVAGSRVGPALQLELVRVAIAELRSANQRLSELVDVSLDSSPEMLRTLLRVDPGASRSR